MALQAVLLSAFATAGGLVSGASWHQRSGAGMRFTRKVRFQTRNPWFYMGVSKNSGTPKWMVYNGKPY